MADGALSPSRAGDFVSCPLLFRYRTVDRFPEPSSPEAVRGTLVHQVLEEVFDLPAPGRTPEAAHALLDPAWAALRERSWQARRVAEELDDEPAWLFSAREAVDRWFTLEDPTRLEPAEREAWVEATLDSGLTLRGVVDRLDATPDGALRVVDYKGLAVDTPLPTPSGWTTMAAVRVGDLLLGSDGRPTRVTVKSGVHHRPCYRVTFRDGSSVVCDDVHLWTVVRSHRQVQTTETVDAQTLASWWAAHDSAGVRQSMWVNAAEPLSLPDVELPIAPWLLGAWLGDGRSRSGELCVGRGDVADMTTLVKQHWTGDVAVREEPRAFQLTASRDRARCAFGHDDWHTRPGNAGRRCAREREHHAGVATNVGLTHLLRDLGLTNHKRIPTPYLRAGTEQRRDLLRGLLDTDGWWNAVRHRAGFTTTDDQLADDVVELMHTLGLQPAHFRKPYANPVRPDRTWHVVEFTPVGFNPFSLPRKALACATDVSDLQRRLSRRRVVASVESVPSVPTQCVAVDAPDSLYLCGDGFVPTHNTGKSPAPGFEARALFQLKIYALIIWRTRGVVPQRLQLVYLGDSQIVTYDPDEDDLLGTERKVDAIWAAIQEAARTGVYQPSRGKQCDWCVHKVRCPEFGGSVPPLPAPPSRWARLRADVRRRWRRWRRGQRGQRGQRRRRRGQASGRA